MFEKDVSHIFFTLSDSTFNLSDLHTLCTHVSRLLHALVDICLYLCGHASVLHQVAVRMTILTTTWILNSSQNTEHTDIIDCSNCMNTPEAQLF